MIDLNRPRRRKPGVLFALDDPVLDDPSRVDEDVLYAAYKAFNARDVDTGFRTA